MPNLELLDKIKKASELSLSYFENILKDNLGDKFDEKVVHHLESGLVEITYERFTQPIKGNPELWDAAYIFNVIKKDVKKLAIKVCKDLKACQPDKIQFAIPPNNEPYPYNISSSEDNRVILRLSYGARFFASKRFIEIVVCYLIKPTGEKQNG